MTTRAGHFVQIWRPIGTPGYRPYVEVEGRLISRTTSSELYERTGGWSYVSRELDLRRAKKFARAYARAGFLTRVIFEGNAGEEKIVFKKGY